MVIYVTAEAVSKLRVQSSDKEDGNGGGGDDSSIYPDRPGEPDCIYFLRTGLCGYGATCRFNHPSQVISLFFLKKIDI